MATILHFRKPHLCARLPGWRGHDTNEKADQKSPHNSSSLNQVNRRDRGRMRRRRPHGIKPRI